MEKLSFSPPEITTRVLEVGIKKANTNSLTLLLLGFISGISIAFASEGSNMAAFNLLANPNTYGLGKTLAGAIFGTGLMLVVIAGGELFTGNMLMFTALINKKITITSMLRNWCVVYFGNFVGSIFIAFMIAHSGLLNSGDNMLGGVTLKIAVGKLNITFSQAIILGIMCNILVCLAVWMSYGSNNITDKILAVFFPIWLFVTSGFEHSVANMYYIPVALLVKNNPDYASASALSQSSLDSLTWGNFFFKNLLPVTIGNILGGTIFVALIYYLAYTRKQSNSLK